jgi:NADPH-dependent 2,4-dienoyl-CoA reductase/sulfur reductase-like enzyme
VVELNGKLSRDVVIVGASLAGLRAAETVARVAPQLTITVVGEEAHPPYDRPPLSKRALTEPLDIDAVALRSYAGLLDNGVEFQLGTRAVGLDAARRELHLESGTVSYGALVLACGCHPVVPPFLGARPNTFTLRTWHDLETLRAALTDPSAAIAVLGAGFIGGEVTSSLHASGRTVSLIDLASKPLGRYGEFVAGTYSAMHAKSGVTRFFGDGVIDVMEGGRARFLLLSGGEWVPADVIVVGAGVRPSTDWLEQSALTLDDGIVCDAELRADDHVFAAGDVARWFNPRYGAHMRVEHWTNAAEHGRIAGLNAAQTVLGGSMEPCATVPYFWSDQHGVRMQFAGWIGGAEDIVSQRSADGSVVLYGRQGELAAVFAFEHRQLFVKLRTMLKGGVGWDEALNLAGAAEPTGSARSI